MAKSTTLRLRKFWLQVHKWIGILLAVLIIPISLSGSALVWHDWLDGAVNPERAMNVEPELHPSELATAAQRALAPGEHILSLSYPPDAGAVQVTASRPGAGAGVRPVRTLIWLDPRDGRVVDRSASNEGLVRVLHVLHGSLMVPGVGRQVVGWVGVAMLVSSLTGLWLWWPLKGSWTKGLRWRRRDRTSANLHHQVGFWVLLPLAMLSFTGAWTSFPAFFAPLAGDPPPPDRARAIGAQPLIETRLDADRALAAAQPYAPGSLLSITWPTDAQPKWRIAFHRQGGGTADVEVADAGGKATPPKPPAPETTARLMRRWHDGTGMGPVWQTIIFIGGIVPALLAVTGLMMWLRDRSLRADSRRRRDARAAAAD